MHPTLKTEIFALLDDSLLQAINVRVAAAHWEALEYFHRMLTKHLDLVGRCLLKEETIPAAENVFSLFKPKTLHTRMGTMSFSVPKARNCEFYPKSPPLRSVRPQLFWMWN